MVRIMARISARADKATELGQILKDLVGPTREEPGCVSYTLFQDEEQPEEFTTIEDWTDAGAAAAHMATPHVAEAIAKAGNLLAAPPVIHRFMRIA